MDLHKRRARNDSKMMDAEFSKEAIDDLLIAKLDGTWGRATQYVNLKIDLDEYYRSYGYFFDGDYHNFSKIPPERVISGRENWKVDYKYNKEFFRCDNFKEIHDGLHIVFGGCSNTEGVGAPIEKTWSHMLYEELSKEYKVSGYFNLGKGGYGWHKIISSYLDYEKRFGSPDIFVVNHPNILRDYYWDSKQDRWIYAQQYPYAAEGTEQDLEEAKNLGEGHPYHGIKINVFPTLDDYRRGFPVWLTSWNLFIEYCNSKNTKVVWGMWDGSGQISLQNCEMFLNSYIRLQGITDSFIEEFRKDGKLEDGDMDARDGHPGFLVQLNWKNQFAKFIKNGGFLNENYKKNNKEI